MKWSNNNALWDLLAAMLGVSLVEWDEDFADGGYRDLWGRAPLGEGAFDAYERAPVGITVIDCRRDAREERRISG